MTRLSKSKLLAFRQCEKRLWLEVHRSELRQTTPAMQRSFDTGHSVGAIAQRLYAPHGDGELIDVQALGHESALARTQALLASTQAPIFEAGFTAHGVLAYADVLLPLRSSGRRAWRMVEVKSSSNVKDYQREDAAIQAYLARASGLPLDGIVLANVDTDFVYGGGEEYRGLLKETDITDDATRLASDVAAWIPAAHAIAARATEPAIRTGKHCSSPFECGFKQYCAAQEPQVAFPVQWLPGKFSPELSERVEQGLRDMGEVPDELLNDSQRRVRQCTVNQATYFDAAGAKAAVADCRLPLHALDFETIAVVVPVWPGTSPYEAVPFQYSFHSLHPDGGLEHKEFLDLSGDDPARALAEALVRDCSGEGRILTYSGYEKQQLKCLAARFPDLAEPLQAIAGRLFDLLPIARSHYYHPSQQGLWSIKKVLPAIVGQGYADLAVAGGQQAMDAYLKASRVATSVEDREELRRQLLEYCALDTMGLLYLWRAFADRQDLMF